MAEIVLCEPSCIRGLDRSLCLDLVRHGRSLFETRLGEQLLDAFDVLLCDPGLVGDKVLPFELEVLDDAADVGGVSRWRDAEREQSAESVPRGTLSFSPLPVEVAFSSVSGAERSSGVPRLPARPLGLAVLSVARKVGLLRRHSLLEHGTLGHHSSSLTCRRLSAFPPTALASAF